MALIESIALGVGAGFSLSPHNLALVLSAGRSKTADSFSFIFGALVFDLLALPFIVYAALSFDFSKSFYAVLSAIASMMFLFFYWKSVKASRSSSSNRVSDFSFELSFKRGFLIQAVNPLPYLFWSSAGMVQVSESLLFIPGFLTTVYLSKVLLLLLFRLAVNRYAQGLMSLVGVIGRSSHIGFAVYYAYLCQEYIG